MAGHALVCVQCARCGPHAPVPPTLVIHDRHDREVRWEDGAAIAGAWPQAQLLTTEGLGHRRILQDASVIARIAGFIGPAVTRPLPGLAQPDLALQ